MGLFSSIGTSIAGGVIGAITDPITKITGQIADTRVKLEQEKNNEKRIALEERKASLEAKRDVLIAEVGSGIKLNALVRSLMAIPVVILLWKLVVFDNVFGQWTGWSTPPLSDDLWILVTVIVGFYFVDSIAARFKT